MPCESVTRTVNVYVPRLLGVPEMTPEVMRLSPLGSFPTIRVHVYGGTPPVASRFREYATPAVPVGRLVVAIASGATPTAIESSCVSVRGEAPASVSWTVNVVVPGLDGVPVIAPDGESSVRPAGRTEPEASDQL